MQPETEWTDHLGWLRGFCSRVLFQDPHAAEDICQITLLTALRHRLDPARSPRPWLRRVARNYAFQHLRRRQYELEAWRWREPALAERATDEICADQEELRRLWDRLAGLSKGNAEVMRLRYQDGLLPLEIAGRLGMAPATVHSRLKRSLKILRRAAQAGPGSSPRE